MKRIIEIPKYVYEEIRDKYNHRCDPTVIDDVIVKSASLNEVLDAMRTEIDEAYENLDGYDPGSLGTLISKVDEIIDKYKESEDANG